MPKKVRQQKKPNTPKTKSRHKPKALIIAGLILCLGLTSVLLARWRAARPAASTNAMLAAAPQPVPSFSPSSPSKEYIYAGGRLVATEEPVTSPPPPTTVNLAQSKTATQSSTYQSQVASRAVDGNTDGSSWNLYTLTDWQLQPWLQVDLGSSQAIQSVKLWPRTDCCADQFSYLYVMVSDHPITITDPAQTQEGVTSYYREIQPLTPQTITFNRTGRYVRVWARYTNHLSLAEVEVWGTPPSPPPTNLALNKTTTQSSTYQSQVASRAVDGNTNGNAWNLYTLTDWQLQPWWQVDLGASASIQTIKVWPRTDCCADQSTYVYVFVSDQPFNANDTPQSCIDRGLWYYYSPTAMSAPTVIPVGHSGRYVRVWTQYTNHLSLAEVEIFGTN
ncbi:MAG TPA: discoidin domain-containing protein [Pyrinomonadaceae bacterium]